MTVQFKIIEKKGFFTFDGYLYNKFEGEENTYEPIPKNIKMLVYYKNCKFSVYTVNLLKREFLEDTRDSIHNESIETTLQKQKITFEILSDV